MADSISSAIASYAIAAFPEIDAETRREARRRVLDSVGVALAALDQPGPKAAFRYAELMATGEGCVIWGTELRTSAEIATFVNGVSIRCLDFNDAYFGRDSTHPSDMLGGLIALAEAHDRTGEQLLDAIAVGYEVAVACADAFGVRAKGWDHVNITSIGACAGAARLMGLTKLQAEQAVALTVVPHASMLETRAGELSMWKGLAAPHGARHAVIACQLAKVGVEGPFQPFEGKRAFVNLLLDGTVPAPEALDPLRELASPTRIRDAHLKAWPLGYVSQSAVAATLEARAQLAEGDRVDRVRVSTYGVALELMASPEKFRPENRATADHSLPYLVTAAVDDGAITEETFELARIQDPELHRRLGQFVEVVEDPALSANYPESHSARVELITASGETIRAQVDHPPGHAKNPLSEDQLVAKFDEAARPALGERTHAVREAIEALQSAPSVHALTELLSFDGSDFGEES